MSIQIFSAHLAEFSTSSEYQSGKKMVLSARGSGVGMCRQKGRHEVMSGGGTCCSLTTANK
jgi:hypothetical protein